jgi:hypothetical protein
LAVMLWILNFVSLFICFPKCLRSTPFILFYVQLNRSELISENCYTTCTFPISEYSRSIWISKNLYLPNVWEYHRSRLVTQQTAWIRYFFCNKLEDAKCIYQLHIKKRLHGINASF